MNSLYKVKDSHCANEVLEKQRTIPISSENDAEALIEQLAAGPETIGTIGTSGTIGTHTVVSSDYGSGQNVGWND